MSQDKVCVCVRVVTCWQDLPRGYLATHGYLKYWVFFFLILTCKQVGRIGVQLRWMSKSRPLHENLNHVWRCPSKLLTSANNSRVAAHQTSSDHLVVLQECADSTTTSHLLPENVYQPQYKSNIYISSPSKPTKPLSELGGRSMADIHSSASSLLPSPRLDWRAHARAAA